MDSYQISLAISGTMSCGAGQIQLRWRVTGDEEDAMKGSPTSPPVKSLISKKYSSSLEGRGGDEVDGVRCCGPVHKKNKVVTN